MKKLLLALLVSTTLAFPAMALAQAAAPSTPSGLGDAALSALGIVSPTTAATITGGQVDSSKATGCSILSPSSWLGCAVGYTAYLFLELASGLMWLAGVLLNIALYYGVVDFGHTISGTAGVGAGWGVLRDIGNIVLIFGFIYIGIQTILGLDNFGVKKTLPMLLFFAILLNFSLFISQAIIDTSNLFSTAIYTNLGAPQSSGACSVSSTTAACFTDSGLAGAIANELGIGTVFNTTALSALRDSAGGAIVMIMSTIFVLIVATVFFAAAIMIIIRIVVLVFLMVISPIGFAGMALPPLQKYAKSWWGAILSQSFFVPLYLLLTLVGLKVGQGVIAASPAGSTGGLAGALTSGGASSVSIFITFSIIIGFMIFALMSAKKLGGMGADFAVKTAGGAAFGTTAFVGRRTGGRLSHYAARVVRSSPLRGTEIGRHAAQIFDKGAKSSFDLRATKTFGGLLGASGLKLGDAQKGGFKGIVDAGVKQRESYAESLKLDKNELAVLKTLSDELDVLRGQIRGAAARGDTATAKTLGDQLTVKRKDYSALRGGLEDEKTEQYLENLAPNLAWLRPGRITAGSRARAEASESIRAKSNESSDKALLRAVKGMGGGGGGPPATPPAGGPHP